MLPCDMVVEVIVRPSITLRVLPPFYVIKRHDSQWGIYVIRF